MNADSLALRFASRTAGFDFAVERIFVSMVGNAPFNRDTIQDIARAEISFKDSEGKTQKDVAMNVTGHKSSQPLTHAQEQQGKTRETVVTISVPKGSERDAMRAITAVAKKHKLKAEKLSSMRNPQTQQGKPKGHGRSKSILLASDLAEAWQSKQGAVTVTDKHVDEVAKMTARNDHLGAYLQISKLIKDTVLIKGFEALDTLMGIFKTNAEFKKAEDKLYERLKYTMKQKLDSETYDKLYGAT